MGGAGCSARRLAAGLMKLSLIHIFRLSLIYSTDCGARISAGLTSPVCKVKRPPVGHWIVSVAVVSATNTAPNVRAVKRSRQDTLAGSRSSGEVGSEAGKVDMARRWPDIRLWG